MSHSFLGVQYAKKKHALMINFCKLIWMDAVIYDLVFDMDTVKCLNQLEKSVAGNISGPTHILNKIF